MAVDEVRREDPTLTSSQGKEYYTDIDAVKSHESSSNDAPAYDQNIAQEEPKELTFWEHCKQPGSAIQIIACALLAVVIALPIAFTVDPSNSKLQSASTILNIPGRLWLRGLTAVVMPLIVTAMILAMQRLKDMTGGGNKLARWSIVYYVSTSILAIIHATILISLAWRPMYTTVSDSDLAFQSESDAELASERSEKEVHDIVVDIFDSFIPSNIVQALANNQLLAVLVTAVVAGYLIKPKGALIKAVVEIDAIITKVIVFLIKLAPIGVFFLILSNLMTLDVASIGQNLGLLIGSSLVSMFIHLVIVLPLLFFIICRQNPFSYWVKCSPAWITSWGTASSAATLPVTMRCARARGWPETVIKFAVPLGCLVNMDGTGELTTTYSTRGLLADGILQQSTSQLSLCSWRRRKERLSMLGNT